MLLSRIRSQYSNEDFNFYRVIKKLSRSVYCSILKKVILMMVTSKSKSKVFRGRIPNGSVPADSKMTAKQGKTCFFASLTLHIVFRFLSLFFVGRVLSRTWESRGVWS